MNSTCCCWLLTGRYVKPFYKSLKSTGINSTFHLFMVQGGGGRGREGGALREVVSRVEHRAGWVFRLFLVSSISSAP